jgi:hypothetical protein
MTLETLYSDDRFPGLAALIRAARDWTPGASLPKPSTPPDEAVQNTVAAAVVTICDDVAWPPATARYQEDVRVDRVRHPLTAGMPVNVMPCTFWPYTPAERPVRIISDGPSNLLLIQNLHDPATPYSGALNLRRALGDRARMVTVDSGGHGAYVANGNACGDAVVTEFLVTDGRPAQDAFCPAKAG